MSINKNNIYNVIRVSDLDKATELKELFFFGYDPTQDIEKQSVQVPFSLFQSYFDTKQDKLVAGDLVELIANKDGTVTINVLPDDTKQNKLVNTNGSIILKDLENGTTDISAISSGGNIIQEDKISGTKILDVTGNTVVVTSTSQTNYIGFTSNLNSFKLINISDLQVYVSLDNTEASTNKIIKTYSLNQFVLSKYNSIEFLKLSNGWIVIDCYGITYFPDLADENRIYEQNLLVKKDGSAKIEEVRDIQEIDLTADSLTKDQLNERYPDTVIGFSVICNGITYRKIDVITNEWESYVTTKVQ